VLFFLGAQLYSQRKPWTIPGLFAGVVFFLWAAGNATNAVSVSALIPASLLYIGVAVVFWQESRRQETLADRLLGVSFASWGVLWIALNLLNATPELQGPGMNVVAAAPCAFVAMLMVMALYEEEKRRIERNMLALSISIWRPPALWAEKFSACYRKPWTACWGLCGCRGSAFLAPR